MNAHINPHSATAPAPDVVPDYGAMNREFLAEKLASAYWRGPVSLRAMAPATRADWQRVVDVAVAELQGTPDASSLPSGQVMVSAEWVDDVNALLRAVQGMP